jgi:hypothetical protein
VLLGHSPRSQSTTVRELVAALQKHDQNDEVVCYTEDERLQARGHVFRLLDIDAVDTTTREFVRDDDNISSIKFGACENARQPVIFLVTAEFSTR